LPLASSMLIARARAVGDTAAVLRVERLAMRVFALLGTLGSLLLFFCAAPISVLIGSPDTRYALMAVAPTMLFSCFSGAYRGYFQGYQDMIPTAVSQTIEAAGKLMFGLTFAALAWKRGMDAPHVAAWAMLGLSIGVAVATVYLCLHRKGYRAAAVSIPQIEAVAGRDISLKSLLAIAVPVTISSSVMSLTRLFDMTMILRRLQHIGYDSAGANALYGNYTTMVVPIFNLIPSLITSVALALVPTLTAAVKAGDDQTQRSTARTAIRLTALLSLPASLAVVIYSRTILSLLFRGQEAAVEMSAPMLSVLAVSVFFSCVITTTNAILQAYGRVRAPIISMLAGSALKLAAAYVLIGIPKINIYGAPISTFACDALIVGINFYLIAGHTDILESLKTALVLPLLASLFSVGLPGVLYVVLARIGYAPIPLFLAAVPLTLVFYLLICLRSGIIGETELAMLPHGIAKYLLRMCRKTNES
ncbi:MAG: polysaccharide biosynthesis C-terminal domain-containing protein, partial [Clostridia bacterium]|nr:polysaccharide biosynthesis C-terminal domain-containing protein [Clostridia bacterium]